MSNLRCDSPPDCPGSELFDCDYVFSDVVVLPAREGGTLVQWMLHPQVRDFGEYRYILQTSNAGVNDRHAWKSVAMGSDVYFLEDKKRRLPGAFAYTHYRVRLQTDERVYHSVPLHTLGKLSYEDACIYRRIMQTEYLQLAQKTGVPGLIYKRKISGIPCRRCLDHNNDVARDAGCLECFGTGWRGGYYKPVPCSFINLEPGDASIRYDLETQGPITNTRFSGRAIASPLLITGDVWLNLQNSERYRIILVQPIVEQKGIPIVYQLAVERLPFADVTYRLPREA